MVRPSALAVLRLMTSSNFVGCSTGRSAGLAPFRILSTYEHGRPVECEAARLHVFSQGVHRRQVRLRGKIDDPGPLKNKHAVRDDEEGAGTLPAHGGEGPLEVLRLSHLQHLKLDPQCPRRAPCLVKVELGGLVDRIPEDGHAVHARDDLLEQLQLLAGDLGGEEG